MADERDMLEEEQLGDGRAEDEDEDFEGHSLEIGQLEGDGSLEIGQLEGDGSLEIGRNEDV